jgi:hypothetical protein
MLDKSIILNEIRKINDQEYSEFVGFPETFSKTASRWAAAINKFGENVLPISTTSSLAKDAFESSMLPLLISNSPDPFSAPFLNYVTQLGLGMIGFVGSPPPEILNLIPVFTAGFSGSSAEVCATMFSEIIYNWFKTGTATDPNGITINWS